MIQQKQSVALILVAITLVALGILTRFVPHPANFTAIGAVGIFAGAVMPKKWAIVIPVVAMALSDIFLGFHSLMVFTWGCMMLAAGIGLLIRQSMKPRIILLGSLLASVQFFLITNWAVWMFTPLYSKGLDGLFASYVAGLPFFRNMIAGDLVYTAALFCVYALALVLVQRRQRVPVAYLKK
ncbi:MAG: DUF6580 family putative transport protein [Patescibacteria group bacterium]|jgi:hypothetical protein